MNQRNYEHYLHEIENIPGVTLFLYDENEKCNYQYIVLQIDETVTQINRDQLLEILWAENVLARRYFYPGCHRMEPYCSYFPNAKLLLTETEKVAARVLVLQTGTSIELDDIQVICQIIRVAVENGEELKSILNLNRASFDKI